MKRKTIGISLEYGFHEMKKFIHSGLVTLLSNDFDIIWLVSDKGNKEFNKCFGDTGFLLINIDPLHTKKSSTRLEKMARLVRQFWMVNKKMGSFNNYREIRRRSVLSLVIGNSFFKKRLELASMKEGKKYYYNQCLRDIFIKYEIDMVLSISPFSSFGKSIFFTANACKIDTWYLVNSWKDLYVDSTVPFDFLTGMFVWSDQMKDNYLNYVTHLKPELLHVTGNPTFDILLKNARTHPRTYYAHKYKINLNADWIYYTLMPPGLVNDEIETVILVATELLLRWPPEEKVILVRRNPNHKSNDFLDLPLPRNVVITEHFINYDSSLDLIVQSPEGEAEWIDLINYSKINISVPSTVSLEFLILNKSVLNIGFGPHGDPDPRIQQHFEAGFYRHLFKNRNVLKCMYLNELNNKIEELDNIEKVTNGNIYEDASAKIAAILIDFYK